MNLTNIVSGLTRGNTNTLLTLFYFALFIAVMFFLIKFNRKLK
ncbi:MAG: hypothetical protein ABSG94_09440 [Brevinematales bacterium]